MNVIEEIESMMKNKEINYKLDSKQGEVCYLSYDKMNRKQEKLLVSITICHNPGGKNSLPFLWKKSGYIDRVLNTWISFNVYVTDSKGNCRGDYDPTTILRIEEHKGKTLSCRPCINFDYMEEASVSHAIKVLREIENNFLKADYKIKKVVVQL